MPRVMGDKCLVRWGQEKIYDEGCQAKDKGREAGIGGLGLGSRG